MIYFAKTVIRGNGGGSAIVFESCGRVHMEDTDIQVSDGATAIQAVNTGHEPAPKSGGLLGGVATAVIATAITKATGLG